MQNDPVSAYKQLAKKLSALQKKAQNRSLAGVWEITGCAQIVEIERLGLVLSF
jgi:hypothetical protein